MLKKSSKSLCDSSKQSTEGNKKRGSDGARRKDGKSKKKKAKTKHPSSDHENGNEISALESTALPQGQIMAQFLSTFNKLEQSRFEAFRRSTFTSDAMSRYVAHILIDGLQDGKAELKPDLSHLCGIGQASEIIMVVSTLAKVYTQRLIHEAKVFADENQSIQPQHISRALKERNDQGADHDFFLQNALTISSSSCDKTYSAQRLAAVRLQEIYDDQSLLESIKQTQEPNSR